MVGADGQTHAHWTCKGGDARTEAEAPTFSAFRAKSDAKPGVAGVGEHSIRSNFN